MNNEVRKETNFEHYKDELKEIFRINWAFPGAIVAEVNEKFGAGIGGCLDGGSPYVTDRILDWMAQPYKAQILDSAEKRCLESVIKPFKSRVKYIYKASCDDENCFIRIVVSSAVMRYGSDFISLPVFRESTMYKGMVPSKNYTLEELGL